MRCSEHEWDAIIAILSRGQRWDEMWRLAQASPAMRSAQLLRELSDSGWKPELEEEQIEFDAWVHLALECLQYSAPLIRLPGEKKELAGHARRITCLGFRVQGDLLVSGSADHNLRLWHTTDGALAGDLPGHHAYIQSMATSPDGQMVASGSADRSVRLWRLHKGQLLHVLGGHTGVVNTLAFSPGGEFLASGDERLAQVWDCNSGRLLHRFPAQKGPVTQVAFDPTGTSLLASDQTGLYIFSLIDGACVVTLPEIVQSWQIISSSNINAQTTESALVTSSSYKKIRVWQLPSGGLLTALEGLEDWENLCASAAGRFIAASEGNHLRLWEWPGGTPITTLEGHSRRITALAHEPSGRLLLSAGEERSVRLWQPRQNRGIMLDENLSDAVQWLAIDAAGKQIAYADQNRLYLQRLHDLGSLFNTPFEQITQEEITWAEKILHEQPSYPVEESWLAFTRRAVNWRSRFDIAISQNPQPIEIGEFDIQLG